MPLESILPTEDEHGGEKKGDFDELLAASAPEPDEVLEDQEVATYLRELSAGEARSGEADHAVVLRGRSDR